MAATLSIPPTPAELRLAFPAFASEPAYPDDVLQFWIDFAVIMLIVARWGTAAGMGYALFALHNVILEKQSGKTAATGGIPGVATGATVAKAVDRVSVNYDANATMELDAGHWNYTVYGQRFIRMARMMGAGAVAI